MKKINLILITAITFLNVQFLSAQTLDDVLKEHFKAVGSEQLAKVQSIKATGNIVQSGLEIPFIMYQQRPSLMRTEGTFQGQTFIQIYNGTEGWNVNPFSGSLEPQPMGPDELKQTKTQADIDGMLWNWKDKGYTATLLPDEDVEGTSSYKINIKTSDGDEYNYFIDKESYMILKINAKVQIQGSQVESDTYMSNYMQVDGIAFPGKIENKMNGTTQVTIVPQKYELDASVDKTLFNKPGN